MTPPGDPYADQPMPVPSRVWRHTGEWWLLAVLAAWAGVSFPAIPTLVLAGGFWLAGLAVLISVLKHTAYLPLGWYLTAPMTGLPGWIVTARHIGLYHWVTFATLAGPSLLLAVIGAHVWTTHLEHVAAYLAGEQSRKDAAERARWAAMFADLGAPGVKVVAIDATEGGRQVHLRLPPSGRVKFSTLQGLAENVAVAQRLTDDAVTFARGRHAGEAVMHLDERDILGEVLPFPHLPGWLTVNRPLPAGRLGDGTVCEVLMREVQAMVTGTSGQGKSNLLNVLIALLTRCEDVIVFVIDFKRGRLPAPWLTPWVRGECEFPAVDWVACDRAEAERMLRATERLAEARMASLAGGSAITPDPFRHPQLVVLCDEASDIMGAGRPRKEQVDAGASNTQMAELGSRLTRKGRSEAIMMLWGTQRGTVTMTGSSDLKSQCKLRFALACTSEAEAAAVVPDDSHAQRLLSRLRHPGTGLLWQPGTRGSRPVKFYRLDPKEAADMARTLALAAEAGARRPRFGPADLAALGEDYAARWERCDLLDRIRALGGAPPAAPAPAPPAADARERVVVLDRREEADEFAALAELAGKLDVPAEGKHPSRLRIYAYLAERRRYGMPVLEMEAKLRRDPVVRPVTRKTLHQWMREDVAAGLVETRHGRYFLREDRGQQ
jgi:hypothetical protein